MLTGCPLPEQQQGLQQLDNMEFRNHHSCTLTVNSWIFNIPICAFTEYSEVISGFLLSLKQQTCKDNHSIMS